MIGPDGFGRARLTAARGRFDREFVYAVRKLAMRVLDALVLRRRIAGESAEALRRVKRLLKARDPGA